MMHTLMKKFSVSARTIKNDINYLNEYLCAHKIMAKILYENNEIKIESNIDENNKIKKMLSSDNCYFYKFTSDERAKIIFTYLLAANNYMTIEYFANMLAVSRSTVVTDLSIVKKWCQKNDINLVTKKKYGILIDEALELKSVRLLKNLKNISIENISTNSQGYSFYNALFSKIDIWKIRKIIVTAENSFDIILADELYEEMVLNIALALININYKLKSSYEIKNRICFNKCNKAFEMAHFIVTKINTEFNAEFSDNMESMIYYYLNSVNLHVFIDYEKKLPYIQVAVQQFIMQVGRELQYNFCIDYELYDLLVKHLCGVFYRLDHQIEIINPLRENLVREERALFLALKHNISILNRLSIRSLSDDEISYLLIYFATAMENKQVWNISHRIPSIVIICYTGRGSAQLVVEMILKNIPCHIKGVFAVHQIDLIKQKINPDLVISTVPINIDIPYIIVNPIIKKDIDKVKRFLRERGFSQEYNDMYSQRTKISMEIEELAKKYYRSEDEDTLMQVLKMKVDKHMQNRKNNLVKENYQYMLSELLKAEYIELHVTVDDWKEAIERSGLPLYRKGIITHKYIEAAIHNVIESGPYIVMTKGVAIPHALKRFGVKHTAISLVSLNKPVCFGNKDNDPVKYVFMLATTDSQSHLKALQDLVVLLEDPKFLSIIDSSKSPDQIVKYILSYEKLKESKK